jgi:hypothetical protein
MFKEMRDAVCVQLAKPLNLTPLLANHGKIADSLAPKLGRRVRQLKKLHDAFNP